MAGGMWEPFKEWIVQRIRVGKSQWKLCCEHGDALVPAGPVSKAAEADVLLVLPCIACINSSYFKQECNFNHNKMLVRWLHLQWVGLPFRRQEWFSGWIYHFTCHIFSVQTLCQTKHLSMSGGTVWGCVGYCDILKAKAITGIMSVYCTAEQGSSFREIPVESGILCLPMQQSLLQLRNNCLDMWSCNSKFPFFFFLFKIFYGNLLPQLLSL